MMDDPAKYYEDYLSKKEGKGKWVDYWVVVRGSWMLFYATKDVSNRSNFCGSLELLKNTKYSVGKRRSYSFPFFVSTPRGTHLFKCTSNLKRHQWMYVLGLAIKGFPPVPPPSFVPRVTVKDEDGDHVASWESNDNGRINNALDGRINNALDTQDDFNDENDDDDDISLPSGVIYVSTLPNDLNDDENNERLMNFFNKKDTKEHTVPVNAVLCTGITGATTIVNKTTRNDLPSARNSSHLAKPFVKPVSRSTGSIKEESALSQFSSLSSSSLWDERPSTAPFSSAIGGSPLAYNKSKNNLKFSRHMTNSAPDVKVLALEGNSHS